MKKNYTTKLLTEEETRSKKSELKDVKKSHFLTSTKSLQTYQTGKGSTYFEKNKYTEI